MKTSVLRFKNIWLIAIMAFVTFNCSDDKDMAEDIVLTQTEVKTILETDDVSGVADTVLSELYANGNTGKSNNTNDCYSATYTDTGYTVTFNNCVLNGTEDVNGTVTVTYSLENDAVSYTATYVDFYVGNIKINGTRSYSVLGNAGQSIVSFSVTSDMELVMEDESVISENGTKTLGVSFGDSLATTIFTIDGNWTLMVDGDTYKVNVTDTLEGNLGCAYLVSGNMNIDKNGLNITVAFGDGSCDDVATIMYPNGVEEEISLKD
ncbi:hypothetical protein [Maribacter sp. 2210JD10-5]|uniref:hypothetical protein n=1 Tax=Maribacter sp. 2210JD10-5 TaxID=3386272 RepID=UPI0039BC6E95